MIHMIDNAYIQGYSHIQEGSPREDFGETKVTESCRIFAVADGHGVEAGHAAGDAGPQLKRR